METVGRQSNRFLFFALFFNLFFLSTLYSRSCQKVVPCHAVGKGKYGELENECKHVVQREDEGNYAIVLS
jgi:hypothetical protein